jgi:hypothetical protein
MVQLLVEGFQPDTLASYRKASYVSFSELHLARQPISSSCSTDGRGTAGSTYRGRFIVPSTAASHHNMVFLPIKPCCLKGKTLPGEPRGVMEQPNNSRTILRYHAKPRSGSTIDKKTAVVLFYDAFGFKLVRFQIIWPVCQLNLSVSPTQRSWQMSSQIV